MRKMNSRNGKMVVMVAVGVAALLGGVLAGVLLGPKVAGKQSQAAADDKHGEKPAAGNEGEADEEGDSQIVGLGEFLVNLRSAGAIRYLQAEVAIGVSGLPEPKKSGGHGGGEHKPSLSDAEMALTRDRVIAILSAADFEQARSPEGRESLRQRLSASIAKALPEYKVHEVLFTSFVMQ